MQLNDAKELSAHGIEVRPSTWMDWADQCPFCDGKAEEKDWLNFQTKKHEYFMRCTECRAVGPSVDSEEGSRRIWGEVVRAVRILSPGTMGATVKVA